MFETPNLLKYPKNGALYPSRGLNKADNRLQVRPDEAVDLTNWLFVGDTLLQRAPFRPFSTTDFATPGRFRGAHDYQAPGANARLLFYCNNGTIKEYLTDSTEADRVTGLATGIEGDFVTAYDAVAFANGSDSQCIGRGTSWRVAIDGIATVSLPGPAVATPLPSGEVALDVGRRVELATTTPLPGNPTPGAGEGRRGCQTCYA